MDSCHEAKAAATALKLDHFLFGTRIPYVGDGVPGNMKNYFNADLDTFWLVGKGEEGAFFFPDDIEWFCGSCNKKSGDRKRGGPCGNHCFYSTRMKDGPAYLRRLAINLSNYVRPGDDEVIDMGSLYLAWCSKVKEVVLVVESYGAFETDRDVVFVPLQKGHGQPYNTPRPQPN
jgi:hypothetical protein